MAQLNQNFVKFEGDNFAIQFTVVDSTNITGYKAWFGLTYASTYALITTSNTIIKRTSGWLTPGSSPDTACSATYVGSNTGGITVNAFSVDITINYADMEDFTPTGNAIGGTANYLYELILSSTGGQCRSTVATSGFMDIREALFNAQDYRGDYP